MSTIKGKVTHKLEVESGQGANGEWRKQSFVLETEGEYPKSVCFETWGAKVDVTDNFEIGQEVTVHYNLESREYNERWYTTAKAWKFDVVPMTGSAPAVHPASSPVPETDVAEDDLPF